MGIRFDLCYSHSIACRLVTEPSRISFAPSTPRIYKSCTLLKPEGEEGTLTFVSRPNNAYQRLFLATFSSRSIPALQVLVKLVSRSYSQDVHKHMADIGLVPKLYGYAEVEGAPTAYVMEYLDPCTWETLHQFPKSNAAAMIVLDCKRLLTALLESSNWRTMFTVIFKATTSWFEPMWKRNLWTWGWLILTRQGKWDRFVTRQSGIERFSGPAKQENRLSKIMIWK